MNNEFSNEISLPMPFFMNRSSSPTLQEVADSLIGFDAIVKRFPKILSKVMDLPIKSVSTDVNKIEIGSLYEDLIVKFGFGGQEQMDLFLKDMHEKFMNHKAVPFLLFFALLIAGGVTAYKVLFPGQQTLSPVVNSNNTIITLISSEVGKDPETIRSIIERSIPYSESIKLSKDSYKIFKAFGDSDSLKFRNFDRFDLQKDVVKSFPENVDFDSVQNVKDFDGVEVQIRAADMDSASRGWAAKIPSLIKTRIKVKVAEGVDVSKVQIGKSVKADVSVVYKLKGEKVVPNYCILRKIY